MRSTHRGDNRKAPGRPRWNAARAPDGPPGCPRTTRPKTGPKQQPSRAAGQGLAGRPQPLAQRGTQEILRSVNRRAGGDRVGMGAIKLTQLDAIEGDPGVMRGGFQLPGRLADVHLADARLRDAHDGRLPLNGPLSRVVLMCISRLPRLAAAMHGRRRSYRVQARSPGLLQPGRHPPLRCAIPGRRPGAEVLPIRPNKGWSADWYDPWITRTSRQ